MVFDVVFGKGEVIMVIRYEWWLFCLQGNVFIKDVVMLEQQLDVVGLLFLMREFVVEGFSGFVYMFIKCECYLVCDRVVYSV